MKEFSRFRHHQPLGRDHQPRLPPSWCPRLATSVPRGSAVAILSAGSNLRPLSLQVRMIPFQRLSPRRAGGFSSLSSPRTRSMARFRGPHRPAPAPNRFFCESMNSTSAEIGGRVPDEISARRLQDLIRSPQLADFTFQLSYAFPAITRPAGLLPPNRPPLSRPSCGAFRDYAQSLADPCKSAACATRFRTQLEDHRHRTFPQLGGVLIRDAMSPNFPRGHSLQVTRGDPELEISAFAAL